MIGLPWARPWGWGWGGIISRFLNEPRPPPRNQPCVVRTQTCLEQVCVLFPPPPRPPPTSEPSVCRIPNLCVQPLTPQIPECLVFSTVKAGGFGERMSREETLSAQGKKRERHIGKKVMEAIRRRPPSPEPGAHRITHDVPQPSPRFPCRPLQSASSQVPPESANAESFCPRHGAQHKTAHSPYKYTVGG